MTTDCLGMWLCLAGVDSQAVPVYAVTDWLRCARGGHSHCLVAQQSLAARETHYFVGDWDVCGSCTHKERTTVRATCPPLEFCCCISWVNSIMHLSSVYITQLTAAALSTCCLSSVMQCYLSSFLSYTSHNQATNQPTNLCLPQYITQLTAAGFSTCYLNCILTLCLL